MTLAACGGATFDLLPDPDQGSIHYSRSVCEVIGARQPWVGKVTGGVFPG